MFPCERKGFTPTPESHCCKAVDEWKRIAKRKQKSHGCESLVWGFTLLELVLASGIVAVIAAVVFLNLLGRRSEVEVDSATKQIVALLREAQTRSVSQSSSTSWGVYFENSTTTPPFYSLFASSVYSTSTAFGRFRLPTSVDYVTSSLADGASTTISFQQITGLAVAPRSVSIYLLTGVSRSSTITVASSGLVSY